MIGLGFRTGLPMNDRFITRNNNPHLMLENEIGILNAFMNY